MVYNSLKILQREGYLEFTEEVQSPSRLYFNISRDDLYRFQVENAGLDGFIKLILRSYTGLFTGYVKIDEDLLAIRAGINREQAYQFLVQLNKAKVLDYIPQNQTPYICFLKERIEQGRLKISKENYDVRKKDYYQRVMSVIQYASDSGDCRSRKLLQYFGETDSVPCGHCDVCKSVGALGITKFEFEKIGSDIEKILQTPCTYEKLLLQLQGNQQKVREVIKWLLDNKKIIVRIDDKLEWKKESG